MSNLELIPAIIQDQASGKVLMLGYMNQEALAKTRETGLVTFFSRSKQRLWQKGETSGNTLTVLQILEDCDQDALLILVKPKGPTCHTGTLSCFGNETLTDAEFVSALSGVIKRRAEDKPENSYVSKLLDSGVKRIAQKIGEEGVEVALAAVAENDQALCGELADLFFHILVLLEAKELSFNQIIAVLRSRHESTH